MEKAATNSSYRKIITSMKKQWFLLVIVFLLSAFTSNDVIITGTVTSADDGQPLPGTYIVLKGTKNYCVTDAEGKYQITIPEEDGTLVFSFIGFRDVEEKVGSRRVIDVKMEMDASQLQEVIIIGSATLERKDVTNSISAEGQLSGRVEGVSATKKGGASKRKSEAQASQPGYYAMQLPAQEPNNESYSGISENIFRDPNKDPLSTFSIDVDRASYSNVRRFINNGQRPPADAVRIEELINYFSYEYPQPQDDHPFSINTEISEAPWNPEHKLVQVGIQGRNIPVVNLPPSNLVFLIDVSGSMQDPNKLPLVKQSFAMLTEKLREKDKVAIVVYAGAAGVVLEPTSGSDKKKILGALDMLEAGGSTAGGAGLKLAYALAAQNFKTGGNNRVIIATDGDFNVGESSDKSMEQLITEKRKDGIFLTVLGYGMGNYKDSKLEVLADKGNGNYAYIDNITEARKTLVNEFGGTLFTIAKDVKLQLEFNPAKVQAYRLIGYENRLLKDEDFNNDRKDAGELGSGHTVTALYEIIPVGVKSDAYNVDPLKYQKTTPVTATSQELLTIKLRYKKPDAEQSKLIVHALNDTGRKPDETSDNFRFAASVAAFGMLLRESDHVKNFTYDEVIALAQSARGNDEEGFRAEYINMVKSFGLISRR
jgi:Ca-activated chloride channel family protein